MKQTSRTGKFLFPVFAYLAGGAVAATLPEPALWYEFNGDLKPTQGSVILTRWDTASNQAVTTGEGGTYCKVRAELSSNNAVTGCEPYSSSLGITGYASSGWTMAFSAMPSAVSNAVLFALGNRTSGCYDGFALISGGSNVLSIAKWTQDNPHTIYAKVDVPHLNERLHSIVLTCSGLKSGTQWDRDIALYVDGVLRTSFTAAYTPRNEFQMFSVQGNVGSNVGFVPGGDGTVDDFRIYGQVLTPEQAALLAKEYPVWPAPDVNGIEPYHWLTCDGELLNMGRYGLKISADLPAASDFVVVRESGRKAMTGATTYGSQVKYDGDFTLFCSARMPTAANGVLFHLGYIGSDSSGEAHSLAIVRGSAPGQVKLVTVSRGGKTVRDLAAARVSRAAGRCHTYAAVYSDEAKTVTFFVDGAEKGSGSVERQPYNASWQFFSLCGGLGASGLAAGEDGAVEDLRIYGQALTAAELGALAEEFPYDPVGSVISVR